VKVGSETLKLCRLAGNRSRKVCQTSDWPEGRSCKMVQKSDRLASGRLNLYSFKISHGKLS